ncbi:hypothetical protein NPIL_529861, partial [Nephila pilipes]
FEVDSPSLRSRKENDPKK